MDVHAHTEFFFRESKYNVDIKLCTIEDGDGTQKKVYKASRNCEHWEFSSFLWYKLISVQDAVASYEGETLDALEQKLFKYTLGTTKSKMGSRMNAGSKS